MRERALYRHTEVRLLERYGLELSRPLWERWHHLIRHRAPEALLLEHSPAASGGDVWRVWFGTRVVYVCVRDGFIVTALPDIPQQYSFRVREAIRQREASSPERLARVARREWERQAQQAHRRCQVGGRGFDDNLRPFKGVIWLPQPRRSRAKSGRPWRERR